MRFWKCDFENAAFVKKCEFKYVNFANFENVNFANFENVNFLKHLILNILIFGSIVDFCPSVKTKRGEVSDHPDLHHTRKIYLEDNIWIF